MNIFKRLIIIILILLISSAASIASQNVRFADIDLIVQNSEIGKKTLSKIDEVNKSNIKKISNFQKQLKEKENEIRIEKTLLLRRNLKKRLKI